MKRRLILWALALAMMLQLIPFAAFAETEAEPATQEIQLEADTTEVQYGSSGWVSNPLYPELEAKEGAPQLENSAQMEAPTGAASWSMEDLGLEIAKKMESRTASFVVEYKSYSSMDNSQAWQIWNNAFVEYDVPTRGDYIKWHWTYVSFNWSCSKSGSVYTTTITFNVTYHTTNSQETALTKRFNEIMKSFGFTSSTSDYEKAHAIYKWVTENITYDYDGLDNLYSMAHTAYNGIMYGKCVCQGYASIIYRMYLMAGIPVRTIGGDAYDVYPYIDPDEADDNHCWNIAKIDGKWYNLDSTWDEGLIPEYWGWFLKSPNNFPDHSRWSEYNTSSFNSKYPMATSDYKYVPKYNGLVEVNGVWGYYIDGVLQTDYTGLVPYGDIQFYVENGILDFTYTGLVWYNDAWTYVGNSQLTQGYTGLVWFEGEWFYTVDSVIDWTFTGLVPYEGNMFYVQNNHLDWGYTGLAYLNDGWYYVENALLKPDFTGLTYFNDNWFYVVDGTIDWTFTGMVSYNGNLFYVQNNLLDWSYTGIGYHDGGWYYFQNALYTTTFTGLVPFNGSLFYVKNGTIDWNYNGTAIYDGKTYTVKNGAVTL